jgi:hypothetical protein
MKNPRDSHFPGEWGIRLVGLFLAMLVVCAFAARAAAAEEEETLVKGKLDHTWFLAYGLKATPVIGETEVLCALRGGWIIDHTLVVGSGLYWVGDGTCTREIRTGEQENVDFAYLTLEFEYIQNSSKLIHPSVCLLIGSAHVSYQKDVEYPDREPRDEFLVIEPGANVILNVTKFFRLSLGGSYRFVSDVELRGLRNSDLDGFSLNLVGKFGRF